MGQEHHEIWRTRAFRGATRGRKTALATRWMADGSAEVCSERSGNDAGGNGQAHFEITECPLF